MLKGRRIVLGVTGGIAAYKAAELVRELIRRGAEVRVVMTAHACEFVTPLTFETLSGHRVATDLFYRTGDYTMDHISLAEFAELVVITPATANVIGKLAAGIADDLLTTALLAMPAPVLICPAMNSHMYAHPAVQANLARLASFGYTILAPGTGELACRTTGQGRLPEIHEIAEEIESLLTVKDLTGERILVTAGPTREPFDPVRYISNHSSGKMGYALALMAKRRGAEVTLVSGPTALPAPQGVQVVQVQTALEMRAAVQDHFKKATVVIKAAAVADYRPVDCARQKMKKKDGALQMELVCNPDILAEICKNKGKRIVVGFAMESEDLLANAQKKLLAKGMDFIVANDLTEPGAGFNTDTNIIRILDRQGGTESFPLMDKLEVAGVILDRVNKMRTQEKRG
ncbi:MAG: bifunctional phosphopantothenoylcysteine decarboxylase/phosphopantothenate--cysteine ligase CoaBC [Deltaproteobacteria bacterium]|nr:bifunctional phosphopantothenoylcysteine decarboxylase/phosphopantothenate--cysteine ligase CoaBC [Deltaproteobacteria bacterium]